MTLHEENNMAIDMDSPTQDDESYFTAEPDDEPSIVTPEDGQDDNLDMIWFCGSLSQREMFHSDRGSTNIGISKGGVD